MPEMISCPQCQRQLRVPDNLLGKRVKCPSCNNTFEALPADRPPAPQPASSPTAGGEVEERVQSSRPREEDREEEGIAPQPRRRRRALEGEEDYDEDWIPSSRGIPLVRPYSIDMGQWFSYAQEHYSAFLGPAILYMLFFGAYSLGLSLIARAAGVPNGDSLVRFFLDPPLQAGFVAVALAQLRGKNWTFGDFFSGFNYYGALLGNAILVALIVLGCMLPTILVFAAALLGGQRALLQVAPVVAVVNYLAALYILIRASFFNIPLILDRNCGPIEAIQGSWSLSQGHFLGLLGMSLVIGLLVIAGVFLCLVGILFTAPLGILAYTAGYLLIAGTPPRRLRAGLERMPEFPEDEEES